MEKFKPVSLAAVNQCSGNSRSRLQPRVPGGQWGNGAMGNAMWTGVRLRDLARLAGISHPASVLVDSLQEGGSFRHAVLSAGQVMDPDSLLALQVNGADLSLDHGYPARVIVPDNPGVHNTKWVASLIFGS